MAFQAEGTSWAKPKGERKSMADTWKCKWFSLRRGRRRDEGGRTGPDGGEWLRAG